MNRSRPDLASAGDAFEVLNPEIYRSTWPAGARRMIRFCNLLSWTAISAAAPQFGGRRSRLIGETLSYKLVFRPHADQRTCIFPGAAGGGDGDTLFAGIQLLDGSEKENTDDYDQACRVLWGSILTI